MTTPADDQVLRAALNLAHFDGEHEKHYAQVPLHDAVELQRTSRTLKAPAGCWTTVTPEEQPLRAPLDGSPDLDDERAIEISAALFMEGDGRSEELTGMRSRQVEELLG